MDNSKSSGGLIKIDKIISKRRVGSIDSTHINSEANRIGIISKNKGIETMQTQSLIQGMKG